MRLRHNLYKQLQQKGIRDLAYVSGALSETHDGYSGSQFEPILERFAPYTKLYNEKDWTDTFSLPTVANLLVGGDVEKIKAKDVIGSTLFKAVTQKWNKTQIIAELTKQVLGREGLSKDLGL